MRKEGNFLFEKWLSINVDFPHQRKGKRKMCWCSDKIFDVNSTHYTPTGEKCSSTNNEMFWAIGRILIKFSKSQLFMRVGGVTERNGEGPCGVCTRPSNSRRVTRVCETVGSMWIERRATRTTTKIRHRRTCVESCIRCKSSGKTGTRLFIRFPTFYDGNMRQCRALLRCGYS